MFEYGVVEALRNNVLKIITALLTLVIVVGIFSAFSPLGTLKTVLSGDSIAPMPAPEVTTYVIDLSASTNPMNQLDALGSGINEFITGQSLGNPFANTPLAPRSLSVQFITQNSGQAPRIVLASLTGSRSLYSYIQDKNINREGAKQLWDALINARTQIWQNQSLISDQAGCANEVVSILGQQQLLPEALATPARIICQDALQSANSLAHLRGFIANPNITMGSDVAGAVSSSLNNLQAAKSEFPSAHLTLVMASDMVDEVSLSLPNRLARSNPKEACKIARADADSQSSNYQDLNVLLVGQANSKYPLTLLNQARSYWSCYFNEIGVAKINQRSDLSRL